MNVSSKLIIGSFNQSVIEINELQLLDLAEASQRAARLMESDLRYAQVEMLHQLQMVVTISVSESEDGIQPEVILQPCAGLHELVDYLAVQFPAATVQISAEDLALLMGSEMTV